MKRIITISALIATIVACNSETSTLKDGMGEASLKITPNGVMSTESEESRNEGAEPVIDTTDAPGVITVDLPNELTFDFHHTGISGEDGSVVVPKNDDDMYTSNLAIFTGTYDVAAYNYPTEELALVANEGRGDARYYGTKQGVTILDGATTIVDLSVAITNCMVQIKEEDFEESDLYELSSVYIVGSVDGETKRSIPFINLDGTERAWFPVGQTLSLKIYFIFEGVEYYKFVNFENEIVTEAKRCYDVTVRPSQSGFGAITITVDNSLTVTTADVYFDPSEGIPVE